MADLLKERISEDLPPFTNTSTDYFGPLLVKHDRKSEKIYRVIFTCSYVFKSDSYILNRQTALLQIHL